MSNPLVSVIIPVYNVEKYLSKCLETICNQTYNNLEIIIINDGTKDSSGNICRFYEKKDNRIIYIEKINGGLASARNKGLEIAKGEFIMFVDSDDWIELNTVEFLLNEFINEDADMIVFDFYLESKESYYNSKCPIKKEKLNRENAMLYALLPSKFYGFSWNKFYKRNLVGTQKFNENFLKGEDSPFTCEYINKCNKIIYIHIPFYHYRIDSISISRSKFNVSKLTVLDSYQFIIEFLIQNGYDESIVNIQRSQYANQLLSLAVNIASTKGNYSNEFNMIFEQMKHFKCYYLKSNYIDFKHKFLYRLVLLNKFIFKVLCNLAYRQKWS